MIGNKIANKTAKVLKNSQESNSETVANKNDQDYLNEDIYLQKKRQEIMDELRLI